MIRPPPSSPLFPYTPLFQSPPAAPTATTPRVAATQGSHARLAFGGSTLRVADVAEDPLRYLDQRANLSPNKSEFGCRGKGMFQPEVLLPEIERQQRRAEDRWHRPLLQARRQSTPAC